MPTLNLDIDYFEHPKTLRLGDVLANDPQAVLYPIRLWFHCAKFRKKGWIPLAYQAEIERACKWNGEPGRLITTFVKEHWIHRAGPGWQVKDWMERQGHIPAFSERAKQAAKSRWNSKKIGDATSIHKHMLGDATSNAPAVQCSTEEKEVLRTSKKRAIFTPPKPEEVTAYARSLGFELDGHAFCDHYETRGWVPKGYTRQMKSWKAAVRTWRRNGIGARQPVGAGPSWM